MPNSKVKKSLWSEASAGGIVLDYKLFVPGKSLPPGTLWISETMPGTAERGDVTEFLNGPTAGLLFIAGGTLSTTV